MRESEEREAGLQKNPIFKYSKHRNDLQMYQSTLVEFLKPMESVYIAGNPRSSRAIGRGYTTTHNTTEVTTKLPAGRGN